MYFEHESFDNKYFVNLSIKNGIKKIIKPEQSEEPKRYNKVTSSGRSEIISSIQAVRGSNTPLVIPRPAPKLEENLAPIPAPRPAPRPRPIPAPRPAPRTDLQSFNSLIVEISSLPSL